MHAQGGALCIRCLGAWLRARAPRPVLSPTDLLRDALYRRLWISILISSLGSQITLLAVPLTAAAILNASPTQMGLLTAMETVPPACWRGCLSMPWLYVVAFLIGMIYSTAGSAAQIVLTQIVPRARLVEAHARNALASSAAEIAGPGAAGAFIKVTGAPLALLADVFLLGASALILRGIRVQEGPRHQRTRFWPALRLGLDFVRGHRLLVTLAVTVGVFQMCYQAALVVQILVATRRLELSEQQVGLCYVALGMGTVVASLVGHGLVRRIGPGPALVLGIGLCALGWLLLAVAPTGALGIAAFTFMLVCFGMGAVFLYVNFLALRQAVTPAPLLGRMTSTMRWLILLPGIPGALLGGWIGERVGLQAALGFSGSVALLLALLALRQPELRNLRSLPTPERDARGP